MNNHDYWLLVVTLLVFPTTANCLFEYGLNEAYLGIIAIQYT